MNFKSILSPDIYLRAIFVLSLFVLIFIAGITYKHSQTLADSSEWVMHTHKTNLQLEQIFSLLKDAETGQRGFIIARDSIFLEPYFEARQKLNNALIHLRNLVETTEQEQNLYTLNSQVNSRLVQLEVSLLFGSTYPVNEALLKESMEKGKSIMDSIRSQVNKMIALEMATLDERQAKYEQNISNAPLLLLLLFLFAFWIVIFSYWRIDKDLNILKRNNEQLLIQSESMLHAEEIGAFSSWHWNLETKKFTYSDNLYRLLGYEPKSFEPTIENFLQFVHPSDKERVAEGIKEALESNNFPVALFRIVRKDGVVRYFKTLSRLVPDVYRTDMLIGINMDVTEQYLNDLALQERYHELELKNKELASFNHMASHDLQEPLRIVQTYISRLTDKEIEPLTEKNREFIDRIRNAVTRMRILIDSLLLYSRTNRVEGMFEMADLNLLLDNAKQDLGQLFERKEVSITSVHLPTVKVIPFQIQQLFANLISNSIKYSKPDVPLEIRIQCEKINGKDLPAMKHTNNRRFYKISVEDNGIGFEPQYADQIFTLFQRLHHDNEYEGTGIGLSICKKIAENHGGLISAEGRPGEGSTFYLYLPA